MKPFLIILDDWEGRIRASPCWNQLQDLVEIRFLEEPIEQANSITVAGAEFLLTVRERTTIDERVLSRMPNLRLILQTGGHAYHIDTEAAKKRNITIALGRRVKAPLVSVPELTFAFALGLMHLVPRGNKAVHQKQWPLLTGRSLAGRRLGILGLGRHGSRVAHIASTAFNMEVVAWDRGGNAHDLTNGIKRLALEELLETSDLVSIHLRLSNQSSGLMNKERLKKMKAGAILINTARGAIVDEESLAEALVSGKLGGAGLDVFNQEPLPLDSPLRGLDNIMLTPHIGWTVEEVFEEFAQIASTQLIEYMNGTLPKSELLTY